MQKHNEWLKFALDDLKVAKIILNSEDQIVGAICYHSQQSAEKALKAYLVYNQIKPSRTHDLSNLLKQCSKFDIEFEDLKMDVFEINPYAHETRYPDSFITLDLSVAEDAIKRAEKIFDFVSNKLI